MIYRRSIAAYMALLFFQLLGCSQPDELNFVVVDGTVTYLDKPIEGAQVVFHSVEPAQQLPHRPIGITDNNGNFRLTTIEQDDGAPIGEYIVTIKQLELREVGEEMVRSGKNLLPTKYSEPTTSKLRYHVRETPTEPANFNLSK